MGLGGADVAFMDTDSQLLFCKNLARSCNATCLITLCKMFSEVEYSLVRFYVMGPNKIIFFL